MPDVKELSVRDWFAGQALSALIAKHHTTELAGEPFPHHPHTLAQEAYRYADQMMQERDKHKPTT